MRSYSKFRESSWKAHHTSVQISWALTHILWDSSPNLRSSHPNPAISVKSQENSPSIVGSHPNLNWSHSWYREISHTSHEVASQISWDLSPNPHEVSVQYPMISFKSHQAFSPQEGHNLPVNDPKDVLTSAYCVVTTLCTLFHLLPLPDFVLWGSHPPHLGYMASRSPNSGLRTSPLPSKLQTVSFPLSSYADSFLTPPILFLVVQKSWMLI